MKKTLRLVMETRFGMETPHSMAVKAVVETVMIGDENETA